MIKIVIRTLLVGFFILVGAAGAWALPQDVASDEDEAFLSGETTAENSEAEPNGEAKKQSEEAAPKDQSHKKYLRDHAKQGFVNVLFGTGWFLVAPYDKDDPQKRCETTPGTNGREGEPICTGRSGFHFDILGGYGIIPGLEVFLMLRLGVERPSGDNMPLSRYIGAGIKIYSPKDGLFKIGFGIAPLFDFSSRPAGADIGYDFVIHVPIQAHFDIVRWFGAYAQLAPNISFISEFRLEFTGGIGVQGRFP